MGSFVIGLYWVANCGLLMYGLAGRSLVRFVAPLLMLFAMLGLLLSAKPVRAAYAEWELAERVALATKQDAQRAIEKIILGHDNVSDVAARAWTESSIETAVQLVVAKAQEHESARVKSRSADIENILAISRAKYHADKGYADAARLKAERMLADSWSAQAVVYFEYFKPTFVLKN